jgi:hypothetical protein
MNRLRRDRRKENETSCDSRKGNETEIITSVEIGKQLIPKIVSNINSFFYSQEVSLMFPFN